MAKNKKTNAMRMLDRAKIKYEVHSFEVPEEHLSGAEVAELIQANVKTVFKTLVLENTKHEHFVFVIPVRIHRNLVTTVFIGFGVPNGSLNYILSKILVVFLSSSLNFSSNK